MRNTKNIYKVKSVHGTGLLLAKMFQVNKKTVSFALNGHSDTELARLIRKTAVDMGGYPIYQTQRKESNKKTEKK